MSTYKQVIIVRKDLQLQTSKIAELVSMASRAAEKTAVHHIKFLWPKDHKQSKFSIMYMKYYLFTKFIKLAYRCVGINTSFIGRDTYYFAYGAESNIYKWEMDGQLKVIAGCDSLAYMRKIATDINKYNWNNKYKKGNEKYIPWEIVNIEGKTQFTRISDSVCLCVGPGESEIIDSFIINTSVTP